MRFGIGAMRRKNSNTPTPDGLAVVWGCLNDGFPDGSDADKLRGLMTCVRRRKLKHGDHTVEAIAERARAPLDRVKQVLAGEVIGLEWGSVECVLVACSADRAEIAVAMQLYDAICRTASRAVFGTRHQSRGLWPWSPLRLAVPSSRAPTSAQAAATKEKGPEPSSADTSLPAAPTADPSTGSEAYDAHPATENPVTDHTVVDNPEPEDLGHTDVPTAAGEPAQPVGLVAQFRQRLIDFHQDKGELSSREMVKVVKRYNREHPDAKVRLYSHVTYSRIGKGARLPTRELVSSYVIAAGGDNNDLATWGKAYHQLQQDLTGHSETQP
jgi:hypothetical protein